MKILVGVPVIYDAACVSRCLTHIKHADDIIIIDNDSTPDVKKVILPFNKIVNAKNLYVNPAWNQIMGYFLEHKEFDTVIILNSDIYLKDDVINIIRSLDIDGKKIIPLLTGVNAYESVSEIRETVVTDGVAGVFICLTRKMVEIVYPIPSEIRLWFGDNWIFRKLMNAGYKMTIFNNLQAIMDWSKSVSRLSEATKIIEEDKVSWSLLSKSL